VEECGPCPVFASFTLAFALQLRKKHGKTSVRARINLSQVKKNLSQSTVLSSMRSFQYKKLIGLTAGLKKTQLNYIYSVSVVLHLTTVC
jgi:hypothetical protein